MYIYIYLNDDEEDGIGNEFRTCCMVAFHSNSVHSNNEMFKKNKKLKN